MTTTIFLSYGRDDDDAFVARLYEDLTARGFNVWYDRVSMPSRNLTFRQEIRDAISARDRVLLIIGPKASASLNVRQEWQFAWSRANKIVTPILRRGDYTLVPEELGLLHCEDFRDDEHYVSHLDRLDRILREPSPHLGKLIAVPALPEHFLPRCDELNKVRNALRADLDQHVVTGYAASRVGLHGMGGIGKSVLAAAIARDRKVREAFADGVIWVRIGSSPDIYACLRETCGVLGLDAVPKTAPEATEALKTWLEGKAMLLVLDDVWRRSDLEAFNVLGPRCRALITSRDLGLLPSVGGRHYAVELLSEVEALQLMGAIVGIEPAALPVAAYDVLVKCGRLPMAIAISAGMVRTGMPWHHLRDALHEHDLEFLEDRHALSEQHVNLWRMIEVSIQSMPRHEQERLAELAVFHEGKPIPEEVVETVWSHTGGLAPRECRKLIVELKQRSLLHLSHASSAPIDAVGSVSIHDLIRDYGLRFAQQILGGEQVLHARLLAAYRARYSNREVDWPNDGYFFHYVVHHHVAAHDADGLLLNFEQGVLERKLQLGFSLLDLHSDVQLAMAFFAGRREADHMVRVATAFRACSDGVHIFQYESYLIWYGAVLAGGEVDAPILQAAHFIRNQAGHDRPRMISEFLIGLGSHRLVEVIRNQHLNELERALARSWPDGLELLAAEALGRLDEAFELAFQIEWVGGACLCRMMGLVQRNFRHRRALELLMHLLRIDLGGFHLAAQTFDAVVASFGLLPRSSRVQRVLYDVVPAAETSPHSFSALMLAIYLADDVRPLVTVLKRATDGDLGSELQLRFCLPLGWFQPSLEADNLSHQVVSTIGRKPRSFGQDVFTNWRACVLRAHLNDLELYDCFAHEAILIPLFQLWARLLCGQPETAVIAIDELSTLDELCPKYEEFFARPRQSFAGWIYLGKALANAGEAELTRQLHARFEQVAIESGTRVHSRWSLPLRCSLVILMSLLMALEYAFMIGPTVLILDVLLEDWRPRIKELFRRLGVYGAYFMQYRTRPALVRHINAQRLAGKDFSLWLGGTKIWQFAVLHLIEAGEDELAIGIIPRVLDGGSLIAQLRPHLWSHSKFLPRLPSLAQRFLESREKPHANEWSALLKALIRRWCEYTSGLPAAGLILVEVGELTIAALVQITEKWGRRRVLVTAADEANQLGRILYSLAEDGEFVRACRVLRRVWFADPHQLANTVLQSALLRKRDVFNETVFQLSCWPSLRTHRTKIWHTYLEALSFPCWLGHAALVVIPRLLLRHPYFAERSKMPGRRAGPRLSQNVKSRTSDRILCQHRSVVITSLLHSSLLVRAMTMDRRWLFVIFWGIIIALFGTLGFLSGFLKLHPNPNPPVMNLTELGRTVGFVVGALVAMGVSIIVSWGLAGWLSKVLSKAYRQKVRELYASFVLNLQREGFPNTETERKDDFYMGKGTSIRNEET